LVADEVRISIEANPFYVWNLKGTTPIKKKKMEVHKSKVIFGALSVKSGKTLVHACQKQNGAEAVKLLNKIKRHHQKTFLDTGKPILLLWDNGGSHKSAEVKQWLTDNPNIVELDNFPPYSPEFNPIEHVWKELKKHINHLRGTATLPEIMIVANRFLRNEKFRYKLLGLGQGYF
jgi:transposase